MDNINIWLDKIKQTCQHINQDHIDIIIDQCGINLSVIPAISGFSPAIKWCSLYQGLPENIYPEDAPLLVRIELSEPQQVQWLYALAHEAAVTAPLVILSSSWPFEELASWLIRCVDARHEGRPGIFRFWDTRIFPFLFTHIFGSEQPNNLRRPALFWSLQDRDGKPILLEGDGAALDEGEACTQIIFTDSQFESLMCLCDAKQFLGYQQPPRGLFTSKEAEFSACFASMLAATQEKILFDEERNKWVMEHLVSQNA